MGGLTLGAKVGLAVIVMVVLGYACGDHSPSPEATPQQSSSTTSAITPELTVTAAEMHDDYAANEIAADRKYKGRGLVVTGEVQSIDSDFRDKAVVQLVTSNEFQSVGASMAESAQGDAATLTKGQRVTLLCRGDGEIVGSPRLSDCTLRR